MASDTLHLIRRIRSLPGWTVHLRRAGHYLITSPSGEQCFISSTPSDRRSWLNSRAHLRRLGADL